MRHRSAEHNGGNGGAADADSALLSRTLSGAWAGGGAAPSTRVFSVLELAADGGGGNVAHDGDDALPVQLQLERFMNDLLLHI